MRWFWIDRFEEFVSARRARTVKNVTLAEDYLHDHFPGASFMPASLVVEGFAQTGGLLVGEANRFEKRVVLAKITRLEVHFHPAAGDTLVYTTVIEDLHSEGARVAAESHVGNRLQATAELMFAHLADRHADRDMFDPADFLVSLRTLGLYDVGVTADGKKLAPPPRLLDAERQRDAASRPAAAATSPPGALPVAR
jgi:3-hydroxyacyl-[acyl-carrier-protein] dehydratase